MTVQETVMTPALPEAVRDNKAAVQVWEQLAPLLGPTERAATFRQVVPETPLLSAGQLVPGYDFLVKYDGALPGGAYKLRGNVNAMSAAREQAAAQGGNVDAVVVVSTGNHANTAGVAAQTLGIKKVIAFCPKGVSPDKKAKMLANGIELDDSHDTLPEAMHAAGVLACENDLLFIHPYDDPAVVAGQGTIAVEVLDQLLAHGVDPNDPNTEVVAFFPAGGGGIGAGNAVSFAGLSPNVKVVLSQMDGCEGIVTGLKDERLDPFKVDTSCDGAAVAHPGVLPMEIIKDKNFVEDVMVVSKGQVGEAMNTLESVHPTPEPAGALAMAAALKYAREHPVEADGKRRVLVPVTSGINANYTKIAEFRRAAFQEAALRYTLREVYGVDEMVLGATALAKSTRVLNSPARG